MRFEFSWDTAKARGNLGKHGVSFDTAMGVFRDPLALSQIDTGSDAGEERWITIGVSGAAGIVLVVHTHIELQDDRVAIRIISARRPTKREINQYQAG
jgi:uncharacterized protein